MRTTFVLLAATLAGCGAPPVAGPPRVHTTEQSEPGFYQDVTWSPDGARIAFAAKRDGNDDIWVVAADGSDRTRLTDDPAVDTAPCWSPDGSRLAYVARDASGVSARVARADGSSPATLLRRPPPPW